MILAKYDHWRKIKDPLGNESWIHKNLLSSKRFLITIKDGVKLREHSNESSKELALINKNVVMELKSISGKWCNVNITSAGEKYRGWIQKSDVFGVFENEIK